MFFFRLHLTSFILCHSYFPFIKAVESEWLKWVWECGSTMPSHYFMPRGFTSIFRRGEHLQSYRAFEAQVLKGLIYIAMLIWMMTGLCWRRCARLMPSGQWL